MPTIAQVNNNFCTWTIEGELDISAAAAVVAVRGDNLSAVKAGVGAYDITLKNAAALQFTEILGREANYSGATRPASALGVCFDTVTQNPTSGDIVFRITTIAQPTSGAATDATAAVTISFEATLRTCKLVSPI